MIFIPEVGTIVYGRGGSEDTPTIFEVDIGDDVEIDSVPST